MFELDHIVIACTDLEAGHDWVRGSLGQGMSDIGQHGVMGTHNRLMSLGPTDYLEVIAVDPAASDPPYPRWYALDTVSGPPRITNWVLRCTDLEAACALMPGAGAPMEVARGPYRWRMAVPQTGQLPMDGAYPALIQWLGPHPAPALAATGIELIRLTIRHPDIAALAPLGLTDPRIGLEPGPMALEVQLATPQGPRTLR